MKKEVSTTNYNALLALAITVGIGLGVGLIIVLTSGQITWTGAYLFIVICLGFVFFELEGSSQEKKIEELEARIKKLEDDVKPKE